MIVHVTTQGARIVREGRHLIVRKENDICHTLFIHKLEQLVLHGNVIVTPQAMKLLFREGIDTVFLRVDGRYVGRLSAAESKNVFLRRRQFEVASDEELCLPMARQIVRGKLLNMATVLQRIWGTREDKGARQKAEDIRSLIPRLSGAERLDVVRGVEGQGSALYFSVFGRGLDRDFGFRRRVRRPPTDPVNALLSLLYTFLINRAYAAVRIAGLDPYPGVLHALDYGRHSLPLDLVEEFRTIIADTLTLSLFNLGVLKEGDFFGVEPSPPMPSVEDREEGLIDHAVADPMGGMTLGGEDEEMFDLPAQRIDTGVEQEENRDGKVAVRLHPPAFIRVVKAFEKKMNTEFFHPLAEKRMSYAEAMVFQARLYRRVLEGETAEYAPLLLR